MFYLILLFQLPYQKDCHLRPLVEQLLLCLLIKLHQGIRNQNLNINVKIGGQGHKKSQGQEIDNQGQEIEGQNQSHLPDQRKRKGRDHLPHQVLTLLLEGNTVFDLITAHTPISGHS